MKIKSRDSKAYTGGGQGGSAPRPANGELRASHFLNLKLKSEDHKKLVCGPEPP